MQEQDIFTDQTTIDHLRTILDVLGEDQELDAVMETIRSRARASSAELERVQGLHWTIIRAGDTDLLKQWGHILDRYVYRTRPFDGERADWMLEANQHRLAIEAGQPLPLDDDQDGGGDE